MRNLIIVILLICEREPIDVKKRFIIEIMKPKGPVFNSSFFSKTVSLIFAVD